MAERFENAGFYILRFYASVAAFIYAYKAAAAVLAVLPLHRRAAVLTENQSRKGISDRIARRGRMAARFTDAARFFEKLP